MEGRKGKSILPVQEMKKRFLFGFIAVAVALIALVSIACADYVPVKLEVSVSPSSMSAPRDVTVQIKVSNISDDDLPGTVTLYDPNGKAVTQFGDGGSAMLKIGTSASCETTWKVTEKQLSNGKITYSVKYPGFTDDGEEVKKSISASANIKKSAPAPEVTVKRTISPTMAKKGQEVTITYEIENNGSAAITDVKIAEHKNISSKTKSIKTLEVGQVGKAVFTVTMNTKDLTSEGTITYKSSGQSKTYTEKVEATKVVYGSPSLDAKVSASKKSVKIDETVKFTIVLKNTGNTNYDNIRISDEVLGEVFTNQSIEAGKELTLEKEVTIRTSSSYAFLIEAIDASGNATSLTTTAIDITAVDPSKALTLTLDATSDRDVIYEQPGVISFTINVTNPSEVDAENVKITCSNATLYTFEKIAAGQSASFTRDVAATIAGRFQFTATAKDALDETLSFQSNTIDIGYTMPTPEPTAAPTVPVPTLVVVTAAPSEVPASLITIAQIANVLSIVFLALLGVSLLLLLIATIRRLIAKAASKKAYDHLERAARRDYSQEPDERSALSDEPTKEEVSSSDSDSTPKTDSDDSLASSDLFSIVLEPDNEKGTTDEPSSQIEQVGDNVEDTPAEQNNAPTATGSRRRRTQQHDDNEDTTE